MTIHEKKIGLPCDNDGYTLFQCPHCKDYFKLCNEELEEVDITELFCPICGLSSEFDNFFSEELRKHAEALIMNI